MKKNILLTAVAIFTVIGANAQRPDVSMKPILEKAVNLIELIEDQYDQEIVRMEFDIVTDSKETFRTLYDGIEYTIVAFADDRVADLDVRVYTWDSGDWALVKKDSDSSDVAVVSLTPDETARYRIVVSAYTFNSGYSAAHYGLIIFHE